MSGLLRTVIVVLMLAGLGGCVVAPAPGYPYAPGYAVYPPPVSLGIGIGECWHCGGWHHWR